MCGIVGIFGLLTKPRISMFEDMLAMDALRGDDSTGVALIGDKVSVVKEAVLPADLMDLSAYKQGKKTKNLVAMIGHNRAATIGKVTSENAHPFTYKHITLVHNGTLEERWRLPNWWNYQTDTEAFLRCIADHGIAKAWGVLKGAATIVYWDDNEKSLNIISNGKRPFYMQPFPDGEGVAWSSELWTLRLAALRQGVKYADTSKVYPPVNNLLYTFTWNVETKRFHLVEKQLEEYKIGNTIPGYFAAEPTWKQKKKKRSKNKKGGGTIIPLFKTAADSAAVFTSSAYEEWMERQLQKKNGSSSSDGEDYSDAALRGRYPEMFDRPTFIETKGKEDIDTRSVPFRNVTSQTGTGRTAERFKQLFNLVELNSKYCTPEWFMTTHVKCCECDTPFDYNDYFTARILSDTSAMCEHCQRDAWIISGVEPNQIRLQ